MNVVTMVCQDCQACRVHQVLQEGPEKRVTVDFLVTMAFLDFPVNLVSLEERESVDKMDYRDILESLDSKDLTVMLAILEFRVLPEKMEHVVETAYRD